METPSLFFIEIWGRREETPVPGGVRISWRGEYYTFKQAVDNGTVRDDRHVDEMVDALLGKSKIWQDKKPEPAKNFVPWFSVVIGVSQTRKNVSHYTIDFQKHAGAPLEIIGQGMWIYRLIKKNIKDAIKKGHAK